MSWTFHASVGNTGSASSTTVAVTGLTVTAGDLVVVIVKHEGGSATVSVSDGTSTLTSGFGDQSSIGGDPFLSMHYITSSVASGSVTYTATFSAARTFRDIAVMSYTPSAGTVSIDGTPASLGDHSTAVNSGNTTTSGTDGVAFGGYAEFGDALTSPLINGVAADHTQLATGTNSEIWSKTYAGGFTGAASGTISFDNWSCGILAFNLTAGGGGRTTKNTRSNPLGVNIGMNWQGGL